MSSALEMLTQSGVVITGVSLVWKFVLVRPLEKAEEREKEKDKRIVELTDIIKEAAARKRERESLPPREEMPTLTAIMDLTFDDQAEERRRQQPLNPTRRQLPFDTQADYADHRARNEQGGYDTPTHVNPKKR